MVALSNTSGTIVVGYIYDAFGACTVITSGGTYGNWLTDDDRFGGDVSFVQRAYQGNDPPAERRRSVLV